MRTDGLIGGCGAGAGASTTLASTTRACPRATTEPGPATRPHGTHTRAVLCTALCRTTLYCAALHCTARPPRFGARPPAVVGGVARVETSVPIASCIHLRASCIHLRASCVHIRASCIHLRASCVHIRASCIHLRARSRHPRSSAAVRQCGSAAVQSTAVWGGGGARPVVWWRGRETEGIERRGDENTRVTRVSTSSGDVAPQGLYIPRTGGPSSCVVRTRGEGGATAGEEVRIRCTGGESTTLRGDVEPTHISGMRGSWRTLHSRHRPRFVRRSSGPNIFNMLKRFDFGGLYSSLQQFYCLSSKEVIKTIIIQYHSLLVMRE